MHRSLALQLFSSAALVVLLRLSLGGVIGSSVAVQASPAPEAKRENIATASSSSRLESPVSQASEKNSKAFSFKAVALVGVSRDIVLDDSLEEQIGAMWSDFEARKDLQTQHRWEAPVYVYVQVRGFDEEFTKARMSIGFDYRQLPKDSAVVSRIGDGRFEHQKLKSEADVLNAWSTLDFPIVEVVERYRLDSMGRVEAIDFLSRR